MDFQVTATAAMTLLAPYLAKAGENVAGKVGDAMYKQAQTLYTVIKDKFKGDQTAEKTLARVKQEPDKKTWKDAFLGVLTMKLEEDPEFANTIKQLVQEAEKLPGGDNISQEMNISGTTGDVFQIGKMEGNISKKHK